MSLRKLLVLVALAAFVGLYVALDLGRFFSLDELKRQQAAIEAYRQASPWLAAAIFFVVYVAVTALSLPGAAIMTLAGGAVFGLLWGTVLVSFASSSAPRWPSSPRASCCATGSRRASARAWRRSIAASRRDGGFYLFTLRLVPAFPFFMINLVMGLTPMRAWTFYWVSQVGMLAGTIVYVNAGTQLAGIDSLRGILSPALIGSFALLGIFPLIAKKIVDGVKAKKVYARWTKPASFDRNVVVIGGGSAGLVTAYIAAAVKAKVTLIEKHKLGGDCLNTGCVPSKALIRSAKFLSHIARAEEFGFRRTSSAVPGDTAAHNFHLPRSWSACSAWSRPSSRTIPSNATPASASTSSKAARRIVSPWEVEFTRHNGATGKLSTRSIVIAAGARPFVPPIPGIEEVGYLTSDNVWNLRELPKRLVVLGGGPIGCELTQAFARFGAG
jgi:uncharacterized membrane protein YdjX (TVP38/TMEM64 family)